MPHRRFRSMLALALIFVGSWAGDRALQPEPAHGAALVAGVTVTPTSGLTTTENGGTDTFTVALAGQPSANVIIDLASSDPSEGAVSPTQLTFTPANWSAVRTVTVYGGENDLILDGDVAYTIVTTASSADPGYDDIPVFDVSVTNIDKTRSIFVTPSLRTTTEAGGTANLKVSLTYRPTADVIIDLASSDPSEGAVSPARLTFTPDNWTRSQGATVTGIADDLADGDVAYAIVTTASSADPGYEGMAVPDVSLTNLDAPRAEARLFLPLLLR